MEGQSLLTKEKQVCPEVSLTMNTTWVRFYISNLGKLCGKFAGAKQAVEHFVGGFLRRNRGGLLPWSGVQVCGVSRPGLV